MVKKCAEKVIAKKSLLERYDIPIEHLSFEHVTQCKNAKELERIILILRSGEEGSYPELTKHAEECLSVVKPSSTILRVAEPVVRKSMLEHENRIKLESDMNEWLSEMKVRERDLEEVRTMRTNEVDPHPDVRKINFDKPEKSNQSKNKTKRIGACDYAGWDKYDADTELNRIDIQSEIKQVEAKRAQKSLQDKEEKMKKESKKEIVSRLTLSGTELSVLAEKEREKGNEAFRTGDYEEALHFYNSSVEIEPTINAYNNRAITYIKLQRYQDSVNDCNRVISTDFANVKALLRRGLALDHMEKREQALADFESVLKLEPTNSVAINAVNRLRRPCLSKKTRMSILEESSATEDVKSSLVSKENKNSMKNPTNKDSEKKSEKVSKNAEKPFQICFCNNAPSSSLETSPRAHFRDAYCQKVNQNVAKSVFTNANTSGISLSKSSGLTIEEIPSEPLEKSKWDSREKEKNCTQRGNSLQFAGGDGFAKKSTVVIEEIPPDEHNFDKKSKNCLKKNKKEFSTCEKLNYKHAPNSAMSKNDKLLEEKNNFILKEEIKKRNDFPKEEKITSANKKILEKEVNAKIENHKNDNKQTTNFEAVPENEKEIGPIESPYEFIRLWHSLRNESNFVRHSNLLKALPPQNIEAVIGNKLDGDMLSTILSCFEQHFCTADNIVKLLHSIRNLGQVKRFPIVRMFMNDEDKKKLEKIFAFLEDQGLTDPVRDLRKMYDVSI